MLSGRAAPCSAQLAQEHAAEKRSCGRPRPSWAGPRWTMKKDDQPENYNYERCCICGRMLHIRRNVANHVGSEKAMKERKLEALQ